MLHDFFSDVTALLRIPAIAQVFLWARIVFRERRKNSKKQQYFGRNYELLPTIV